MKRVAKQPIEFLFSPYRRAVLARLLLRPDERFHVRELARMTDISAGSLHRELKAMAEAGLLVREKTGNQVFYRADTRCPIFEELASIFRKTMGLADMLRGALADLADRIQLAFVFGSLASGRQTAASDLDICILGEASLREVVEALSPLQETLARDINPVTMTPAKFARELSAGDRFATRISNEPRLLVLGSEDDFEQLVENRPTGSA
jgi:predicted nucleotidyltransferase